MDYIMTMYLDFINNEKNFDSMEWWARTSYIRKNLLFIQDPNAQYISECYSGVLTKGNMFHQKHHISRRGRHFPCQLFL